MLTLEFLDLFISYSTDRMEIQESGIIHSWVGEYHLPRPVRSAQSPTELYGASLRAECLVWVIVLLPRSVLRMHHGQHRSSTFKYNHDIDFTECSYFNTNVFFSRSISTNEESP
ncbi:unnamed protein product [Timema podura]|uniref:Uncharacterized protein n=1 Tax=Timema podura TaxID=61482 RepID=A0ABN7NPS4_TIMPD|nr:unnamed protein product [Timema podura]